MLFVKIFLIKKIIINNNILMDISNILFQKNSTHKKKESFNSFHNIKKKINNFGENPLKNEINLKVRNERENTTKKTIETGKYFLKKILKMRKEINKNEFSQISDEVDLKNKNESVLIKKIGSNIKNSLIQLKFESGFEASQGPTLKKNKSKFNVKRTFYKLLPQKKKEKEIIELKNKTDKSLGLEIDTSNTQLLNNENNAKLELLNNEETKYTINNTINNIKNKDNNINESMNKSIKTKKSNETINSIKVNNKQLHNEKYRKLMYKSLIYDSFDDEEEFEDQINKDFFIMPNSIFIIILDTLVAINILYYITLNPYLIASSTKFTFSKFFSFYDIFHFLIEFIFFIDFLVQFVRAYYDFDENLITNKKKILIRYLGTWFLVDLITVIPTFMIIKFFYERDYYKKGYDYICNYGCQSDNLIYLSTMIKIIKIFKIMDRNQNQFVSYIWSHLSNTTFIDNWGTIIFEVVLAIVFLHITACIHIIIGRNSYPNWILDNNLTESKFSAIYLTSIYFLITTMTSVGYGDITGNELKEFIFLIFLLIIGIISYSWLVSSVSNYVIEHSKDNEYFISKVKILDEIKLIHPEMDNELYNKIYSYLKQLKIIHKKKDKNILLESLPYNLKNLLLYEINRPLIEGLNFFKNFHNSVFILSAVTKLIPIITNKGDTIIEQNEIINNMIFVKQGRIGVELAIDMNNIYNNIDDYLNGNFILGDENNNKDKIIDKYKSKKTFSLMTTLNYTMDDTFALYQGRKLDLNYKKPVSFRKKLLKFMQNNFSNDYNIEKPKFNVEKKIKYVKLYYIRKGEHFGEIFMFLNKPSCFTLKVRSPKAELLLLKKIDAIEISSNHPNIWKRVNKKSFKNLIHLKELVSREMIKFCGKNGIKCKATEKEEKVKHSNSLPNLEKLKKKDQRIKKNDLRSRFKKFQRSNKSVFQINKNRLSNAGNINKNVNKTTIYKKKYKKTKLAKTFNKNKIKNYLLKTSKKNENSDNRNTKKKTPYEKYEINNEIYKGEIFLDNINKQLKDIADIDNEMSIKNEEISFNLFNYEQNIDFIHKNNKDLIKLIDSSRHNKNPKIYYHKNKKNNTINNNNYNVHYNINNSFNINQIQNNIKFNINQLSISNCICFKINKIYDNLNILSKGNFPKDYNFQKKIKNLFQNKYSIINNNNNNINNNNDLTNLNNVNKKMTKKEKNPFISVSSKPTFFKRQSKLLSLGKEIEIKNEQNKNSRRRTLENIKAIKMNKDEKIKKDENNSNAMLNQITRNIIEGDKNLNNPKIFYNELFANIIQNKNAESPASIIRNIQGRKSIKLRNNNNNNNITKKKSLFLNNSFTRNLLIK